MSERAVTVEQKRLYNEIADTLDFKDSLYDQTHWGQNMDYWVDDDGGKWEGNEYDPLKPIVEHLSCNTTACVAGWACLLSNYHPTIMIKELDKEILIEWLPENIHSKITYNYEVMCNFKDMFTPSTKLTYSSGQKYLTMDDIDEDTGKINKKELGSYSQGDFDSDAYPANIEFIRPDSVARGLLNLDEYDSEHLFSGDVVWCGDHIRSVGKGAPIHDLIYYDSEGYEVP